MSWITKLTQVFASLDASLYQQNSRKEGIARKRHAVVQVIAGLPVHLLSPLHYTENLWIILLIWKNQKLPFPHNSRLTQLGIQTRLSWELIKEEW